MRARVVIFKNGEAVVARCINDICYEFEAEQGDEILVSFKFMFHTRPVANFVCGGADDIVCVYYPVLSDMGVGELYAACCEFVCGDPRERRYAS